MLGQQRKFEIFAALFNRDVILAMPDSNHHVQVYWYSIDAKITILEIQQNHYMQRVEDANIAVTNSKTIKHVSSLTT